MAEHERSSPFERFEVLGAAQAELAQRGYFLQPIPKEHTEALVTGPLLHKLSATIKKRGFGRVAGHVAITFSGYGYDPREIYEIPEIRTYWRTLDRQLPELPALLTTLPVFGFNGPGQHLLLLGTVDERIDYPARGRYHAHVVEGQHLIADGVARIRQAGRKYHLSETAVANLIEQFRRNAGAQ